MKRMRKPVSLILVLIMTLSISLFASGAQTPEVNEQFLLEAIDPLIQANAHYYDISAVDIKNVDTYVEGEFQYTTFDAELTMCLKFATLADFPYVKGVLNALKLPSVEACTVENVTNTIKSTDTFAMAKSTLTDKNTSLESAESMLANTIVKEVDLIEGELGEYVGQTNNFHYTFLVKTDLEGNIEDVQAQNFEEFIPLEEFFPASEEEMANSGRERLLTNVKQKAMTTKAGTRAVSPLYDRKEARNYVQAFSSEAPASKKCPHGRSNIDISYYNPNFTVHCHNDCANFVSQGINGGKIPTDSVWFPDKPAYIRVSELRNYFLNTKGYWNVSNFTNAGAGGIIINKNSSGQRYHVNMIVLNDSVNHQYAAHNADHVNQTFTAGYWGSGETQEYYMFNNYTPA